jgi:signal transduction histidine kinase
MTHISAPEDVGVLWLQTLQRAMARASHDVKDALNGVSVNLEVIRTRAERADLPATSVAQFAEAAGNQLERLTSLLDAVLALGRPERDPVDVGQTLRRVAMLCSASSSSADATVRVRDDNLLGEAATRVHGAAVRLALLAPLLEATAASDRTQKMSDVVCTLGRDADGTTVMLSADGRHVVIPDSAAESLRAAGVRWTDDGSTLTLSFPHA